MFMFMFIAKLPHINHAIWKCHLSRNNFTHQKNPFESATVIIGDFCVPIQVALLPCCCHDTILKGGDTILKGGDTFQRILIKILSKIFIWFPALLSLQMTIWCWLGKRQGFQLFILLFVAVIDRDTYAFSYP